MSFYRVLRRDELGFFQLLPGGEHDQSYKAIREAQTYHEQTGTETQVVNQRTAVIWNSTVDMHSQATNPLT